MCPSRRRRDPGTTTREARMDGRADVTVDVAIVGGGIAGAALATVLARDGYDVLLLERQTSYRDKVRGEFLSCWGVAEMLALDLEKPLVDAGGHYITRAVMYDELVDPETAEANAAPLDHLLPGVPGCLDIGHPQACEGLAGAAAEAGATVVRGVGDVEVVPGRAADPALRARRPGHDGVRRPRGRRRRTDVECAPPTRTHPARHRAPNHGGRPARRRARRLAREPAVDGHRGRP